MVSSETCSKYFTQNPMQINFDSGKDNRGSVALNVWADTFLYSL